MESAVGFGLGNCRCPRFDRGYCDAVGEERVFDLSGDHVEVFRTGEVDSD